MDVYVSLVLLVSVLLVIAWIEPESIVSSQVTCVQEAQMCIVSAVQISSAIFETSVALRVLTSSFFFGALKSCQ